MTSLYKNVAYVCKNMIYLCTNVTYLCKKVTSVLPKPEFYGNLVHKLKKNVGTKNFSAQFIEIISNYIKIGYTINVL